MDGFPKPLIWIFKELSPLSFGTLLHRIDRKNPDKDGLALEPLIVETKLFRIHDQRL